MLFFPEIDNNKTKANAKRKLREYPRWRRIAGDIREQKVTATYSFEPRQKHSAPSRPLERLVVDKVSAEQELDAIEQAISGLFDPLHRRILFDKFLDDVPDRDYVIYSNLDLSASLYYETLDNALLAFAELYRNGALVVVVEKTWSICRERQENSPDNL